MYLLGCVTKDLEVRVLMCLYARVYAKLLHGQLCSGNYLLSFISFLLFFVSCLHLCLHYFLVNLWFIILDASIFLLSFFFSTLPFATFRIQATFLFPSLFLSSSSDLILAHRWSLISSHY